MLFWAGSQWRGKGREWNGENNKMRQRRMWWQAQGISMPGKNKPGMSGGSSPHVQSAPDPQLVMSAHGKVSPCPACPPKSLPRPGMDGRTGQEREAQRHRSGGLSGLGLGLRVWVLYLP